MNERANQNVPSPWARSRVGRAIKRCFDILMALGVLVLFSPLLLLVAVLVKTTSRGPVFFLQKRLGRNGRIFEIFKFRTMVDRAWEKGAGLSIDRGDARITVVGRFLRMSHIDELPQFFNVLRGDMSVVGPRPTLPFQYDYYEPWEKQRVEMPPGITGWVQAHGATAQSWDERIKLDVWYVQHWSLWLDVKICVQTVVHILARSFGKREIQPPNDRGWTRGVPVDPFTHSGASSEIASLFKKGE